MNVRVCVTLAALAALLPWWPCSPGGLAALAPGGHAALAALQPWRPRFRGTLMLHTKRFKTFSECLDTKRFKDLYSYYHYPDNYMPHIWINSLLNSFAYFDKLFSWWIIFEWKRNVTQKMFFLTGIDLLLLARGLGANSFGLV